MRFAWLAKAGRTEVVNTLTKKKSKALLLEIFTSPCLGLKNGLPRGPVRREERKKYLLPKPLVRGCVERYVHTIHTILTSTSTYVPTGLAEHQSTPIRHRSHEPRIESGRARSRNNTALADSYRSFMFSLNPNLSQVFGFSQVPFFFFLFFLTCAGSGLLMYVCTGIRGYLLSRSVL